MADDFRQLFEKVDVVVTPTEPLTAWKRGATMVRAAGKEESVFAASWRLTYPFNLTGCWRFRCRVGLMDGMPIGKQVAAMPFAEGVVLRCGRAAERIAGWRGGLG